MLSKSTSGIVITDVADHFGTFDLVSEKQTGSPQSSELKRIISDSNIRLFKQYLNQTDFGSVQYIPCPNEAYNTFYSLYKNAFNAAFPLTEKSPRKRFIKKEPWVSTGLLTSSRTKSKLLSKKLRKPTPLNIHKYKMYVNLHNKLKRKMKINYFKDMLESNKNNMKHLWTILKQAIGKQRNKSNFPSTFTINNKQVSVKSEITESFNNYFSNISIATSQNIPKSKQSYTNYLNRSTGISNSIFIEPVDSSYIIETANKLQPKLSSVHDEISPKLLKETLSEIIIPITHIINRSLDSGIVPDQLKIAKVIPIYKASDSDQLRNYRPISLLPAFSKLIEKIMYNKVMSFLNSNNILYKHQYEFRPKHSTIHPIIHLINHCAKANDANPQQYTMSIFCDLSKPFDVINHEILITKLNVWGIRGSANKWFQNYLSDRKQYVEIENTKSDFQNIMCGVPQGSILGALLYLIYVNDISKSTNGHILSFADDTSLYFSDSDPDDLFNQANSMFADLFDWFCANRLSLNPTKTKYIVFRPQNKTCDFSGKVVAINGTPLNQIGAKFNDQATKFLGIYIDEHLTWKHHLAHINTKISRALFIIKQVKNVLPVESLRTLYFALIHPFLSYGVTVWGNVS
jgi:hypothetical protein